MEGGPSYKSLNVNSCKAKRRTTQVLDNLNEVRSLIIFQYGFILQWLLLGRSPKDSYDLAVKKKE